MTNFDLNGYIWRIKYVEPYSDVLIDRTGRITVATTDPATSTVYISTGLEHDFRRRVIAHEISHCVLLSYGFVDMIHKYVYPEYWVEAEEAICNYIADYSLKIMSITYKAMNGEVWLSIPKTKTA